MAGHDMLVRLYDLEPDPALDVRMAERGISIRRLMAPDVHRVQAFVRAHFTEDWADAALCAAVHHDCYVAVKNHEIVGFACNEASTLDYFGPIGVDPALRGQEIGKALLLRCLFALREKGYNYAVIGWADSAAEFYRKCVNAVPIEDSIPRSYRNLLAVD